MAPPVDDDGDGNSGASVPDYGEFSDDIDDDIKMQQSITSLSSYRPAGKSTLGVETVVGREQTRALRKRKTQRTKMLGKFHGQSAAPVLTSISNPLAPQLTTKASKV